MRKKVNSRIYQFENYIRMQKINCIFKIRFNNDELTPRAKNIKTIHMIEIKWGIRICFYPKIFTMCLYAEKGREGMFKKYFKILVVSKS